MNNFKPNIVIGQKPNDILSFEEFARAFPTSAVTEELDKEIISEMQTLDVFRKSMHMAKNPLEV